MFLNHISTNEITQKIRFESKAIKIPLAKELRSPKLERVANIELHAAEKIAPSQLCSCQGNLSGTQWDLSHYLLLLSWTQFKTLRSLKEKSTKDLI